MTKEVLTTPIDGKQPKPKPKEVKNTANELLSVMKSLLDATENQNEILSSLVESNRNVEETMTHIATTLANRQINVSASSVPAPIVLPVTTPVASTVTTPVVVPVLEGGELPPVGEHFPVTAPTPSPTSTAKIQNTISTAPTAVSPAEAGRILKEKLASKKRQPNGNMSITPPKGGGASGGGSIAEAAARAKPIGTMDIENPEWLDEPTPYNGM